WKCRTHSRSHALRGNAVRDAPRPLPRPPPATQSVEDGIPTQSVGTSSNLVRNLIICNIQRLFENTQYRAPTPRTSCMSHFHRRTIVSAFLIVLSVCAATVAGQAVDPARAKPDPKDSTAWYDARDLAVEGKGWNDTKAFYDRLPARAEGVVRGPVWGLSRQSA